MLDMSKQRGEVDLKECSLESKDVNTLYISRATTLEPLIVPKGRRSCIRERKRCHYWIWKIDNNTDWKEETEFLEKIQMIHEAKFGDSFQDLRIQDNQKDPFLEMVEYMSVFSTE